MRADESFTDSTISWLDGHLDTAPDGPLSVTVGSPAEAVMIRSDDWILVVMPVLVGDETAPAPDAPLVPATDGRAA